MSVRKTVYSADDPTPENEAMHAFTDVRDWPDHPLYIEAPCNGIGMSIISIPWHDAVAMAKAILSEDEHAAL